MPIVEHDFTTGSCSRIYTSMDICMKCSLVVPSTRSMVKQYFRNNLIMNFGLIIIIHLFPHKTKAWEILEGFQEKIHV